ncbi:MAG: hypothetical protein H7Z37_11280, partial [Pyrinomonadaceae bacterium]|nr:hypothetical protein [Pyrinomonadaceae bacterium]
MNQTNDITQIVRDVAKQINNGDGQDKFLRALEKVSACVEISPPLTLEKLMQIYGTEVIYYTPEDLAGKVMRVGRITTAEERESWLNALKKLDRLSENHESIQTAIGYGLLTNEAVIAYLFSFSTDEFDSLTTNSKIAKFADEIAMGVRRLQDFIQIREDVLSNSSEDFDFLRNLRHGEKFTHQLEWLTQVVEDNGDNQGNKIKLQTIKSSAKTENQRVSGIATESMLKRDFLAVSSSASYQAMREVVALKKFDKDLESPYPTAYVEKATIKGKIRLTPLKNEAAYGEQLKD